MSGQSEDKKLSSTTEPSPSKRSRHDCDGQVSSSSSAISNPSDEHVYGVTNNMPDSPVRKRFEVEEEAFVEAFAEKRSAVDSINTFRAEIIPQMLSRISYQLRLPFFSVMNLKPFFDTVIEDLKMQHSLGKIKLNSITEEDAKVIHSNLKGLITNAYILENGFLIDSTDPRDAFHEFREDESKLIFGDAVVAPHDSMIIMASQLVSMRHEASHHSEKLTEINGILRNLSKLCGPRCHSCCSLLPAATSISSSSSIGFGSEAISHLLSQPNADQTLDEFDEILNPEESATS